MTFTRDQLGIISDAFYDDVNRIDLRASKERRALERWEVVAQKQYLAIALAADAMYDALEPPPS